MRPAVDKPIYLCSSSILKVNLFTEVFFHIMTFLHLLKYLWSILYRSNTIFISIKSSFSPCPLGVYTRNDGGSY